MRIFLRVFVSLILLITGSFCFADTGDKTEINSTPQYQEYFNDYAKRLYENFCPEIKHFFFTQGNFFFFFINHDGTIEHLDTFLKSDRFTRYAKKVILKTPTYPLPEQIKDDKIFVYIYMGYYNENTYYIDLCGKSEYRHNIHWKQHYNKPSINIVDIHIEKDCLKSKN